MVVTWHCCGSSRLYSAFSGSGEGWGAARICSLARKAYKTSIGVSELPMEAALVGAGWHHPLGAHLE